jgi:two-component system LytT family response regulator
VNAQQPATVRAIIVDDEELARSVVREHLDAHPEVEIVAECSNGFDAVKAITELGPDLVFLDIQMPKLNGFEVHAVDYLLKPFTKERFEKALHLANEEIVRKTPARHQELLHEVKTHIHPLERILVREGSKVHVIPVDRIDYIEAQDDYVSLRAEGKSHLKQERLSHLETSLNPRRFVRIHRSYILNIDRLAKIELYAKDSRLVILKDGTQLPVSRTGYEKLKGLL